MVRKLRSALSDIPQHIVQRGNKREPWFIAEVDCLRYIEVLKDSSAANSVAVHADVFITKHVHLMATPGNAHCISHMMQDMGSEFVR